MAEDTPDATSTYIGSGFRVYGDQGVRIQSHSPPEDSRSEEASEAKASEADEDTYLKFRI